VSQREFLLVIFVFNGGFDAIKDTPPAHVPWAQNLNILIENQPDISAQLVRVIGHWQNACHDDNRNSQQGWQELWRLLGKTLGHDADTVAGIGIFCLSSDAPCPADTHDKTRLLALRRTAPAGYGQWVYLLACFGIYLQQLRQDHQANAEFTLLGWRLVLWWLGLPPRHRAASADYR
jgi:hypothetical protein